jgi:phosphopantothenoylcysteine decarboxylase / phosphopantothenate---cysteine ligase
MPNARAKLSADESASNSLPPRKIVLGITGGIAAYKSAELTRLFVKAGVDVTVVMTDAATKFVTPVTLQALSGNKVYTDLWDADVPNNMAHIELTRGADLVLVAPATGDFMAKIANGLANDLLSTLCLARNADACPLLLAPAMNREMWDNPATQRNVATLRGDGVTILGPAPGDQACGETGMGRMLEPQEIFDAVMNALTSSAKLHSETLANTGTFSHFPFKKAVVTAGPTFEAIDPVRGITNSSSGKMGYAIAEALRDAGCAVTLVSGPTALARPVGVNFVSVKSASQMLEAVEAHLADVDAFFAVAAVADYTPAAPNAQKMKKSAENLTLNLVPTVDILAIVAAKTDAPFCVGFAAESENVVEYATKKRQKKQIPMIVANHANSAIGADVNEVTIIDDAGAHPLPQAAKALVARQIVAHAAALYTQLSANAAEINANSNIKSINVAQHAKKPSKAA